MTDFYRWMEENRKRQGELTAIFEKQIEYIANANKRIRELEAENRALQGRVRGLEQQRLVIARYLETVQMCEECPAYKDCPSTGMLGAGACVDEIIKWGERFAKEAGE